MLRNWKPVLKDGVYCSPACGGGRGICDKSKYDLAVKKSKALAKRMGKGWKPEVWENLGWHYSVQNGLLEVTPPHFRAGAYTGWVQTTPQFIVHHNNPITAINAAIKALDEHVQYLKMERDKLSIITPAKR